VKRMNTLNTGKWSDKERITITRLEVKVEYLMSLVYMI
jgi:hypothetical protein